MHTPHVQHMPMLQTAPSMAYAARFQTPARRPVQRMQSQPSLSGPPSTTKLYQPPQVSKLQTSELQQQHTTLPPQTARGGQQAPSSVWVQTLRSDQRKVVSLNKSILDATHPSNLSNKSTSSAGTCGSDIGYASTTSSEHVNDGGALSDTTSSSNGTTNFPLRTLAKDVNTNLKEHTAAKSFGRQTEVNKRHPCRSMSPTPSPKESAVPVPTRLCAKLALSPRVASPQLSNRPTIVMPGANQRQTDLLVAEEDAVGQPEHLDKLYGYVYTRRTCEVPSSTVEEEERAAKVSDALREAELAREFAMATLGRRGKRTSSTPQAPGPQIVAATPRWSIPSIWDSGEVHNDLLSWFADELGVSKDATADINVGLMQTYGDQPLTSRTAAGSPRKPSPQSASSLDFGSKFSPVSVPCSASSPSRHVPPPISPSTSRSESINLDENVNVPFKSVLAAQTPLVKSMESEDGFAPEPRMLVSSATPKASN
eukprot:gnl/MRDRNA2_/MRDRNA2_87321_c0_seq1.p1 gnl/MRDRNA2_/MRDRNA2_87321_c0~~gnl/MRDRNA2_/MRDRNA2_87321_c0_seq1.p1  ORF type:complete len:482 (+),score=65.53 gnl/MRDRNA2_/MRDRNA2_87321_c0_seq1:97-1542(+)